MHIKLYFSLLCLDVRHREGFSKMFSNKFLIFPFRKEVCGMKSIVMDRAFPSPLSHLHKDIMNIRFRLRLVSTRAALTGLEACKDLKGNMTFEIQYVKQGALIRTVISK